MLRDFLTSNQPFVFDKYKEKVSGEFSRDYLLTLEDGQTFSDEEAIGKSGIYSYYKASAKVVKDKLWGDQDF